MSQKVIKVGVCVSYDYEMLKRSLPRVYEHADIICLAVDKNRKSWSGNVFDFDNEAFYSYIKELDKDHKIDIYEDDFALPELNARENCNLHRTKIAERMGKGGWHIQIDSDEYFFDFNGFVKYLKNVHPNPTGDEKGFNVSVNLIPLIKKVDNGYVFVDFKNKMPESAPFATNKPQYETARQNGYYCLISPFFALHETWARSEDEIWFKMNNWGHSAEELKEEKKRLSYYNMWKAIDENNYHHLLNFHPTKGINWPRLNFAKGENVEELFGNMVEPKLPLNNLTLTIYNKKVIRLLRQYLGDPFKE